MNLFLTAEPVFFNNIQHDPRVSSVVHTFFQQHEVRAMALLPLWASDRQLGMILFGAQEEYYFTEAEIQPYIALARQVAVALENRRLLEETRLILAEVEATQRRYTVQTWEAYQAKTPAKGYEKSRENVASLVGVLPAGIGEAIQRKQATIIAPLPALPEPTTPADSEAEKHTLLPAESNLIVPLTVRDEVIGVLGLQEFGENRPWLPEEIELVQAIAEEIALAAENIRLLDDTQQRAAREQRVNEIGEKIRAAQSLEEALQIAVKEVGLSLKAPQTTVKLGIE
jgi:GAF domain-containing protein